MSLVRRPKSYGKLLRKLNERLDSPKESVQSEAIRTLAATLMHLDAQKSKREARAIRLKIEKLRAEAIKAQAAQAHEHGKTTQEPSIEELAAGNPEIAKALADYRAAVGKEEKEK